MFYIKHKAEESLEDYLETIMLLTQKKTDTHAIDIARELGFSKPSVSVALKNMREKKLVTVSKEGVVALTDEGRGIAEKVYERHMILTEWLESLGVPKETAEKDACRIEHDMSEISFNALKKSILEKRIDS